MIQAKFCVYIDRRGDNNKVFYVGKGSKNRVLSPFRKNPDWVRVVLKCKGYTREVIFESNSEQDCLREEIKAIKFYGRSSLVNRTDGGGGTKGAIRTLLHRQRISEAKTGVSIATKGRKFSEAHKKALSIAHKGYVMPKSQKEAISRAIRETYLKRKSI